MGLSGPLTKEIPVTWGVIWVPFGPIDFYFVLNYVFLSLSGPEFYPLSLGSWKVSLLLYADDMVLVSLTYIGLRRMFHKLVTFCKVEAFIINFTKTKVEFFRKRP